jgi:hypothetical protein
LNKGIGYCTLFNQLNTLSKPGALFCIQGQHRLFTPGPGPLGAANLLGFADAPKDAGGFRNVAPKEMARPSAIRTVIAADFDNDGYEELFFNNIAEPNRLFRQVRSFLL